MNSEPHITVNGVALDNAQAMVTRVAVHDFLQDLSDPAKRKDLGGIASKYEDRLTEVQGLMFGNTTPSEPTAWSPQVNIDASSALPGIIWFSGWLFTTGYIHLGFWKGCWALAVWPFYLGVHFAR